jgi:rhodanese-related sulfurtransferase
MVKRTIGIISILLLVAGWGWAASSGGYNFISADDLQKRIKSGDSMIFIDICPVEQFAKGHIKGSLETNAYPVEKESERDSLAKYLPKIKASSDDVIIVCPRGSGGAKRTFDFYKSNAVEEKRLLILEKGMDAWPYETEKK